MRLMFLLLLGSCAGFPQPGPVERLSADLVPGAAYRTTTKWGPFDVPIYPQAAVWIESEDGRYLGTLFVTAKAAKDGWVSAPREGRPEALPVWSHRHQGRVDAVSSATSSGETRVASDLAAGLPPGRYTVFAEVNRSYDYNQAFPRETSGVSGQPSVVYQGVLTLGEGNRSVDLAPVGTGSTDGSDGTLRPGLEGIDTALQLFSKISVSTTG
jgi:hypothetical protein